MPIRNFETNASMELIPAEGQRQIKLLIIWYELSANANLVCLRWDEDGEPMFPKCRAGLGGLNLIGASMIALGPEGGSLWIYVSGNTTVRGTIVWKYH